ncbi:MAG: hypothetical protein UU82_C0007G0030 [Candidatus Nomurabacteria bacterium GW2011_GWC2_41_8]|uniref:Uncharacterized protein n=3 Tax=Candidatus Nomuraibacteriota TaxID=1752729 RepID=A0A1F6Y9Z4_9BACT|nr:MAG: hypothetical protein UU58_C0003G0013 [Candidatus Nomurabacteria bacterium GW2011_GWA2_41_25]KKS24359.1 MAG: hypothetical protein UU82_C0007G0030 [Candidatus Nomurabacteria bacterium GW2011_GWC2_41_8]OGI67141.1 MAG: hypothetical protein A2823_01780 [Candidatus Nomurabacteria bacterium RIFCSPHIGHO2_01_FULL_41_91]OGI80270.1 MAG: hypothetical protein A3D43_01165 [Candidatus Nomurabacteria bacterium RIFCSPHIGHO2_02_FULL_41_52]OGI84996.1 MAG: hypothetical protein A3F49_00610 [Candidatus Nomur
MNDKIENSTEDIILDPELSEQLKKLVLERVGSMPDTLRMSVGSGELTKDDILKHVEQRDNIGNQVIEMELEFLRDLANGMVYAYE